MFPWVLCIYIHIKIYSHLEKEILTETLCKVWKKNGILLENSRKNNVNEVKK